MLCDFFGLHIRDVDVTVRSDDEGSGSNLSDLTVLAVSNTVEEVEHSRDDGAVEHLDVENYGAACNEVVCYGSYLLVGFGADNLELDTA